MRFTPPVSAAGTTTFLPTTLVWRHPAGRGVRRLGAAALNTLAAGGVVCLLAAASGLALDVTPLVVRSGSMSPEIPVGALALARSVPAGDVTEGEVVSVVRPDGTRVTHRVVQVSPVRGDMRRLTLQGDANEAPDADPVVAARVDRVIASLPGAGRLLELLGSSAAVFVAGLAGGVALLWAFGPPTERTLGRWVPERRGPTLAAEPVRVVRRPE